MKKTLLSIFAVLAGLSVSAQDAQQAAAQAAKAIVAAPQAAQTIAKPSNWKSSLKTQLNIGQTSLSNWAAGGDNTMTLQGFVDGNANWTQGAMFWNNRLQLDYGFVYASSKPILQKSDDRIYLESKWGYKAVDNLYFSANYDFKSQFSTGWVYNTPSAPEGTTLEELELNEQKKLWAAARDLKSNFLAPAYTNIALGLDYKPTKWLSVNFAPLTGGFVIVKDEALRSSYSMDLKKMSAAQKEKYDAEVAAGVAASDLGQYYKSARFEFGAQLKVDAKVNVNDNFAYSTQVVLFSNYLDKPENMRVNWDSRIDWKLAKYFTFTITTNLIYDDKVLIKSEKDIKKYPNGTQRVQFKESLAFGFTYTIASRK